VVHYHPHYYVRGGALARIGAHVSWALLSRCRRVVFVAHEPDPAAGSRLEEAVRRWAWRRAPRVIFHSAWERERHRARFGQGRDQDLAVTGHGEFFATAVAAGREEARAALGLGAEPTILLMIGFLSAADPDKGYDRAIEAVRAVDDPRLQLHIVGSPIREGAGVDALLDALRAAADGDRIVLHEQFVDDDAFDLWVRAADAVLTPYRTASSSGVIARARLLGTRVITSDAGGLAEQAGAGDIVVADDEGLREAVRRTLDGR
jgi:glycosyltransferase involved in cell wall biosynthesis